MIKLDKKKNSVTMKEKQFRELVGILRDESRWGDYISIIKNDDGTRTISIKDNVHTQALKLLFIGG